MYEPIRPSLVDRPDFLAACASPRLRRMVVGFLEVAVGLLQRRLALHHAGAGAVAEVLDEFSGIQSWT